MVIPKSSFDVGNCTIKIKRTPWGKYWSLVLGPTCMRDALFRTAMSKSPTAKSRSSFLHMTLVPIYSIEATEQDASEHSRRIVAQGWHSNEHNEYRQWTQRDIFISTWFAWATVTRTAEDETSPHLFGCNFGRIPDLCHCRLNDVS